RRAGRRHGDARQHGAAAIRNFAVDGSRRAGAAALRKRVGRREQTRQDHGDDVDPTFHGTLLLLNPGKKWPETGSLASESGERRSRKRSETGTRRARTNNWDGD